MKTLFRLLRRLVVLVCIAAVLLTALPPLARLNLTFVELKFRKDLL